MSTDLAMNRAGTEPERGPAGPSRSGPQKGSRKGWVWIGVVLGLLTLNVGICTVTVIAARQSAPPIEANYDAKALRWDDSAAQREMNRSLGWSARAEVDIDGETAEVVVRVLDSTGRTIRIADVAAVIAIEPAVDGQSVQMRSDESGRYSASVPDGTRAGEWLRVSIAAKAGGMTFCDTTRVRMPERAAIGGGR